MSTRSTGEYHSTTWLRPTWPTCRSKAEFDVRYLRYWVSEDEGKVFCLVEAPSPDAASTVHREAHGLVADDVFLVKEGS